MASSSSDDFSVVVLASDLGVDARPFLNPSNLRQQEAAEDDNWHDCPSYLPSSDDHDFSDLEALQFFRLERGSDNSGNRIFRIVGKYFPGNQWSVCVCECGLIYTSVPVVQLQYFILTPKLDQIKGMFQRLLGLFRHARAKMMLKSMAKHAINKS